MDGSFNLEQDLAPRRRVYELRTDPAATVTTKLAGTTTTVQKLSKRSRISRFFSGSPGPRKSVHAFPPRPQTQSSPLLELPEGILNRILFYALDLPKTFSLNFPYSPLPDGCVLHLASTPPPPIFLSCRALRKAAQNVLFKHATFNVTLLSGGATGHFWLHHDWTGDFMGPKRCVQTALRRAEKVEIALAVPTFNTKLDSSIQDPNGLARRGLEKEDWDVIRKCLAVCVAYIRGRKPAKSAIREMSKQMTKHEKIGSLAALCIGKRSEVFERAPLVSLKVTLSKRDPETFVTSETNEILDMLGEIRVDGKVEVGLEYQGISEKDVYVFERHTEGARSAVTKEWPEREAVIAHLREIGRAR